ncbi:MAG: polysaccharide biosynthesis C-terminal domain-containing protein, partial [Gammaproteobacteria bacterium]|nr:polysaccharide biosynthesis C-terminal domain-containing protein [Gammaproteobacteria bacterium]
TSMFFNNILIAKGFTRSYMLISLLALGVNLAVIMLLVNHLGIISAASGMTLGLLTSSLISGRIAMKASSVSS